MDYLLYVVGGTGGAANLNAKLVGNKSLSINYVVETRGSHPQAGGSLGNTVETGFSLGI